MSDVPTRTAAIPRPETLRRIRFATWGVFLIAAATFLLLMSGHIYARDEETLYQMTDGIARHGVPLVSSEVWGIVDSAAPSKNGLRPTSYAPGQALLALPWYGLGRIVGAVGGERYAVYLTRFCVLAFNAFVTAALVALLFRFAVALGYRLRVGVALAACYGLATFAAIQARTFFAEPLTALLAFLAFFLLWQSGDGEGSGWRQRTLLAGSGFTIGFALLVKIHAALFLPALALALVLPVFPSIQRVADRAVWRSALLRSIWWGIGFAPPVIALLLYNRWLYGGPFTTGYGDSPNVFTTPLATGLHGLLWSGGKGLIWYAPPLAFAIVGAPRFVHRFPRAGVAVLCAALLNILFYARLAYWHGDGSWGPRYLLIVLPWLMLPALPTLDRLLNPGRSATAVAARGVAVAIVLAGVLIQSLALAVSFDTPIIATNDRARHFTPSQSPIVVSYRTARTRFATWRADRNPPTNSFTLAEGLYPAEGDHAALFPRWTAGSAHVTLNPQRGAALHIKLTYFDHRPAALRTAATPVVVTLGKETLNPGDRLPIAPANEGYILAYDVPPATLQATDDRLTIDAPTWNPSRTGVGDRDEDLGIFINNLEIWADGVPLTARERTMVPPVPETPRNVWVWANYPNFPHLLDWWPILLVDTEMPRGLTAAMFGAMLGTVALLFSGGACCLWTGRRTGVREIGPPIPVAVRQL